MSYGHCLDFHAKHVDLDRGIVTAVVVLRVYERRGWFFSKDELVTQEKWVIEFIRGVTGRHWFRLKDRAQLPIRFHHDEYCQTIAGCGCLCHDLYPEEVEDAYLEAKSRRHIDSVMAKKQSS